MRAAGFGERWRILSRLIGFCDVDVVDWVVTWRSHQLFRECQRIHEFSISPRIIPKTALDLLKFPYGRKRPFIKSLFTGTAFCTGKAKSLKRRNWEVWEERGLQLLVGPGEHCVSPIRWTNRTVENWLIESNWLMSFSERIATDLESFFSIMTRFHDQSDGSDGRFL